MAHWLEVRDTRYLAARSRSLLDRYGLTSGKAKRRVLGCMTSLARYDCYPTFPTPGHVVRRDPDFCRELQNLGAELIIHGYDHLDFSGLLPEQAASQMVRAADAYARAGIEFTGFRCPYLSCTEELISVLPRGMFEYSSNKAVWWDVVPDEAVARANAIFRGLSGFYQPASSSAAVAVPTLSDGLLECPPCVPDDIQLLDGLRLGETGTALAWTQMLRQIDRRGELFVLLFHPESYYHCGQALESVLAEARSLRPHVWITQLRQVNRWWREKAGFSVETSLDPGGLQISFNCSDRATVLIRNVATEASTSPWNGSYRVLEGRTLRTTASPLPFVGVSPELPAELVSFLVEQGYVVKTADDARRCAFLVDSATVSRHGNPVGLIEAIEASAAPLVRFSRWPDAARSGLCLTGDLDALSLVDYAARLFA